MHKYFNNKAMYYQLTRLSILAVKQNGYKSQFAGSSKFKCMMNEVTLKKESGKPQTTAEKEPSKTTTIKSDDTKKYYKLKKNKIRNKILNFFSLNASKKFCAFYTITFPMGIPDETAYKILNTWLTRCRKNENLKSYLWVAERQKNNTLHFHLITNNFMRIRTVNEFMKSSLLTEFERGNLKCNRKIIESYNGIDVDNLYNSKRNKNKKERLSKSESQRKLSYYLTKYISKNDTLSERLPWHCSRDISALFISINYSQTNPPEIARLVADNPEAVITYEKDYFTISFFKFQPEERFFDDLIEINNLIFETFHPN